jgi:hypothetical protein
MKKKCAACEKAKMKKMAKGGSTSFGMLSVKKGIDNNPNPTFADKIAGAKKSAKKYEVGGIFSKSARAERKSARGEKLRDRAIEQSYKSAATRTSSNPYSEKAKSLLNRSNRLLEKAEKLKPGSTRLSEPKIDVKYNVKQKAEIEKRNLARKGGQVKSKKK